MHLHICTIYVHIYIYIIYIIETPSWRLLELQLLRNMAEAAGIWDKDLEIHNGHVKFHTPSEDPTWMLSEPLNIYESGA